MFVSQKTAVFDFTDLDEIVVNLGQKKYSFWAKKDKSEAILALTKKTEEQFELINQEYTSFTQEQKIITLLYKLVLESKDNAESESYETTLEVVKTVLNEISNTID